MALDGLQVLGFARPHRVARAVDLPPCTELRVRWRDPLEQDLQDLQGGDGSAVVNADNMMTIRQRHADTDGKCLASGD